MNRLKLKEAKNEQLTENEAFKASQLPRVGSIFLHNAKSWKEEATGGLNSAGEALRPDVYQEILLDSIFTLSPSGHNPETFRLYEAAEAGSIPIVDNTNALNSEIACNDPWIPFIYSGAPFVWIQNWDNIESILQQLHAEGHAALEIRQRQLRSWYSHFIHAGTLAVESTIRAHETQAAKKRT